MPIGPEQLLIFAIAVMICLGPGIIGAFVVWAVLRNRNMAPEDYPPRDQDASDVTISPSSEPEPFGWSSESASDATVAELSERLTRIERRLDDLERDRDPFR